MPAIADIPAAAWDACANPAAAEPEHNPFISHAFLSALEGTFKSATARNHLAACAARPRTRSHARRALPAYLKSSSHSEIRVRCRLGGGLAAIITPRSRSQCLTPASRAAATRWRGTCARELGLGIDELAQAAPGLVGARRSRTGGQLEAAVRTRLSARTDHKSAGTMAVRPSIDFLRRARVAQAQDDPARTTGRVGPGIETMLTGAESTESFFRFYMDTGARKWGTPYLNRAFFSHVGASMRDHILLVMAKRNGRYIAGAVNFLGLDALYGRNWGAIEEHPFLHFEICYYQAIEFAISRGLSRVEAGAQGEHKLARGYRAVATFSAHDIGDKRFARAIEEYLQRERIHIDADCANMTNSRPSRRDLDFVSRWRHVEKWICRRRSQCRHRPMTRQIFSRRSCAASCRVTRSMRTIGRSPSWTYAARDGHVLVLPKIAGTRPTRRRFRPESPHHAMQVAQRIRESQA